MSKIRQIRSFAHTLPDGFENPVHSHTWDQLLYGSRGVLFVRTEAGSWVMPPLRACWIPANVRHAFRVASELDLRTLYLPVGFVTALPRHPSVLSMTPLVRELVLHLVAQGSVDMKTEPALVELFRQQLEQMEHVRLHLPWPSDPRARKLARAMTSSASPSSLNVLCRDAGASRRTLERLFLAETGVTLGRWRTQLRISRALALLADGVPVVHVADELGYATPSAFIEMFRRNLGETPSRYHKDWSSNDTEVRPTPTVPVPTTVFATGEYLGPATERP